jgi:hypothetical protein
MTCRHGEMRASGKGRIFFCDLRRNGCPFVRWCIVDKCFKMLVKASTCSNYTEGEGNQTPSPDGTLDGKNNKT